MERPSNNDSDELSDLLLHGASMYATHELGRGRSSTRISKTHRQDKSNSPPHSASATTGSSESNVTTPSSPVGASTITTGHSSSHSKDHELPHSFTPPSDPFATQTSFASDPGLGSNGSAIKLLVSNNAAGSIIGRAGQTISELQTGSNTRIKLSQSGDYYPGTQDRVCLIQGDLEAVRVALRLLLERLYMMQETQNTPAWHQHQLGGNPKFDFVVRLLVPMSCCGMIIGKNGSNIKFMEDTAGVTSIRLSPKDDGIYHSTAERVVSITGTSMESCLHCAYLVMDGMTSHPDISRYSNMTTSYNSCPLPQGYSPPSIAAIGQPQLLIPSMAPHLSPRDQQRVQWELPSHAPGLTRRSASTPDLLTSLPSPHRTNHFQHNHNPTDIGHRDIVDDYAFSAAAPFSPIPMPQQSVVDSQQQQQHHFQLMPRHSPFEPQILENISREESQKVTMSPPPAVPHSLSAPNLLAMQMEHSLHITSPIAHHHPHHLHLHEYSNHSTAFVPQTPIMIAQGCFTAQILIPDSMIGSILGRGGRTLTELQLLSATRIRISQRGEYMPGTRSRIVTIRGSTDQAVWQAQFLISQRIVLPPTATYQHVADGNDHEGGEQGA